MPSRSDYYRLLRVSQQATPTEIKVAFRRLARQYHPDLNPNNPQAAAEFRRISEAYQILSGTQDARQEQFQEPASPHQSLYVKGMQYSVQGDYLQAIDAFTQAVTLNPQYLEAYLGRCQAKYALGDDRGVVEDGYYLLKINPNHSQAYYYQGRARARLGFLESSIAAYTRSMQLEPTFANAYYYRGIAHQDLQDHAAAKQDWKKAAELFKKQGNTEGLQRAQSKLQTGWRPPKLKLNLKIKGWGLLGWTLRKALTLLPRIMFNPGGELLPAFGRLSIPQAAALGLSWAVIANALMLVSLLLFESPPPYSGYDVLLLFWTAFGSLVMSSAIARFLTRSRGHWSGDVFVSGAVLLPVSLFAILASLAQSLGLGFVIATGVFMGSYAILTLYVGCTQVQSFLERSAAIAVPLMLVTSGGITAWVATEFLG
ncbi:MAG: DnaJ domain-containing protein [Thermosynechococcaceae cyanobacterium]